MKNTIAFFLVLILSASIFISFCKNEPDKGKGTQAVMTAVAPTGCNCESDWFPHSQTPAPAEGKGSPFDTSSTTNCIFHQWSWQKFLWLTKPLPSGNPLFLDSMILVSNQMVPVAPVGGVELVLEDTSQAGGGGVLVSNPAFAADKTQHTVYYGIFINAGLQTAANSMKNAILKNTALLNNNFTFPVGSLELKTSWVDVNALPASEAGNYFTTTAVIMPGSKKITAALLGMHVVGVVENHPEFIWATFEHLDMAPSYDWKATTNQDVPVTSNVDKLFFAKGYNATWNDLQYNPPPKPNNVFTVYKLGIPRIANDSFMTVSQSEPINFYNITGLNACVAAGVKDVWQNYFYNGSIWLNMDGLTTQQQADTILAQGGSLGNGMPGSQTRGCLAAFNITMETYMQVFGTITQMNAGTLNNCFGCHNAPANISLNNNPPVSGKSPLYLSHIFRSYLSVSSGVPINKIEQLRTKDFIETLALKKAMLKK